jgi:uncharacterized protein involved in exopolysaccharide biosynthesis
MSDEKIPPMQVSNWSAQPGPLPPSPQTVLPAAESAREPAETSLPEPEGAALPVDPWRLLGGAWKRRRWILAGLCAGALLGLGFGLLHAKTRYQASVQLIKRELPSSFRVGETGEAFRPHELSAGTLIGAAGADNVLRSVAAKSSPKIDAGSLRRLIEVKDLKNTEFVYLTISGFDSAAATVNLANLWAEEVVQFTRQLQSQESREMRQFLQQQVDVTDADLQKLNGQILEFSKREDLVDADKQIDAYLRSLGDLDIKYETARINLDSMDFKIKGAEAELRRQSPLAEKLRTSQSELEELRSHYTDQNPLVIEKLAAVKATEEKMKAAAADTQSDPASYAGTFLGNTLYLDLVQYENEKKGLIQEKEELGKLRDKAREKLNAVPEKAAAFAQLSLRKHSLETARNLLFSRLREAQLFEENSPGYYRIFEPASLGGVIVRGKMAKVVIFTLGGCIGFAMLALFAALAAELTDPLLRTGAEASKSFKAPLLASLEKSGADSATGADIWVRWIAAGQSRGLPRIVWSPSPGPEDNVFWEAMFDRASHLLPALCVIDCGAEPPLPDPGKNITIERLDAGSLSIAGAQQLGARLREACRRGGEVWIRLTGPVHEPLTTLALCGAPPLVLVRLHGETGGFWNTQGELLEKTVGRATAVVAVGDIPWRNRS